MYQFQRKERTDSSLIGTFTKDLHEIARWLRSWNIDNVAIESTGVYKVQPFLVFEECGFVVFLVNARYKKRLWSKIRCEK